MDTVIWPFWPFFGREKNTVLRGVSLPKGREILELPAEVIGLIRAKATIEPSPRSYVPTDSDLEAFRCKVHVSNPIETDWPTVRTWLVEQGFGVQDHTEVKAFLRLLEAIPGKPAEPANQIATDSPDDLSPQEKALALLVKNPSLSNTEIAKRVGVSRTTLNKPSWEKFQGAREALKSGKDGMARGQKNADGAHVEAWDDDA